MASAAYRKAIVAIINICGNNELMGLLNGNENIGENKQQQANIHVNKQSQLWHRFVCSDSACLFPPTPPAT